eukprot:scaffold87573_cov70-Phaeocystis_antarctica.AAC.1
MVGFISNLAPLLTICVDEVPAPRSRPTTPSGRGTGGYNTVIHPATADFIECNGMYNGEAGRYLVGLLSFSNVSGRRRAAHVRRWPPRYTTFSAFSKLATRCVGRAEHGQRVGREVRPATTWHVRRHAGGR